MTSTDSQPVLIERDGGVAVVRLNRPEAMNSLNDATKVALLGALTEVADDEQVRCVVLTGSGRAFCVGQDLKEHVAKLTSGDGNLHTTVQEHYNPIATLIATMDKPVVAALNGVAAGAGASFAFAADFRILSDQAGFNMAFAGIALSCDSSASYFLPRLVGMGVAKQLLLQPRTVKAAEALSLGLATSVVPADEFDAAVRELAGQLAAGPTKAYGAIRRAVEYASGHSLADALAFEGQLMSSTGDTADHRAAVDAFLAKQKPVFTGR